jgi:hypothetical protein
MLEEIPAEAYWMNMNVRMRRSITLPEASGKGGVRLHKGEHVLLTRTDDRTWVDLATDSGLFARCSVDPDGKLTRLGLDASRLFEGLLFAD